MILALADDARQRIADQERAGQGRVAVGAIPTVAPFLLPRVLRKFARKNPQASIVVYEKVTERIVSLCLQGEVDLIVLALPVEHEELHVEPLFEDELLLALPASHPLASRRRLTLADVVSEPFILLNEEHCLTGDVLALCRRRDFQPRVTCRGSQLDTVQRLIALGQGISLIPRLAVEADTSRKRVYRPLDERPGRTVVIAWRKNRYQSRLTRDMIETIRSAAK
jgi:LysR family hydrogen peroxide-inducible transcriptional activator